MITVNEQETMSAIKTACRKYINSNDEPDADAIWDERRFQLVKQMLPLVYDKFYSQGKEKFQELQFLFVMK